MSQRNQEPAGLTAAAMLIELKRAHAHLRACMGEMEALTSQRSAAPLEYTRARFSISKASLHRRSQFNAVCAELLSSASPHEDSVIKRLKAGDRALLAKSAAHVLQWTAAKVAADWLGYCAASRKIRREMALELEAEEAFLVPLFQRRSARQVNSAHPRTRAAW